MGVLHVMRGKSRQVADLIPVDYVCNTILTAAWHTAHNPPGRRIPIFHSASSGTPLHILERTSSAWLTRLCLRL
jgi:hypothetical protein